MPASLPGSTLAENQANPSAGKAVIFDPLSGPKASPFDARKIASWSAGAPVYANDPLNCSTGGLSTGIGFGPDSIFGAGAGSAPLKFSERNFTDDYIPGEDAPSSTIGTDSRYMYIGGGRSTALGVPNPYDETMVGLCAAGNGGSRDGGTTPFTGFPLKTVTATGAVANGAAVEAGFTNRSGVSLVTGQSVFGSNTTPNADVS